MPSSMLEQADLLVDAIYEGGRHGNSSDDPLPSLIGVSNQGGFRYLGSKNSLKLVVLITSFDDPNWPDNLDAATGLFTYYGDNKVPGKELHDTPRFGNQILRDLFSVTHLPSENRNTFPPILLFHKIGVYRDVRFLGLAVPGAKGLSHNEDLVAIWKISAGKRFQNYRAKFTVLDCERIASNWIKDIKNGYCISSQYCPEVWSHWLKSNRYFPLTSSRTIEHRNKNDQLPGPEGLKVLNHIVNSFSNNPYAFERCAIEIVKMMLPHITETYNTRPSRDGGRDAVGKFRIGNCDCSIEVEFSLEAKCYDPSNSSVGVKETSRLISRLRHRQFGILITTSYVNSQAYKEIKEDGHPIIIISGKDIVNILKNEFPDEPQLLEWLKSFIKKV
jgi:hypothetical protein